MRHLFLLIVCAATAFSQPTRDELWREDITQAVDFVTARHPALFTNVTREDFDAAKNSLLASIPGKSDAQVMLGFQRLLALARDGHTFFHVLQNRTPLRRIPLRFYWFTDGIFVTDASAPYVSTLGARVVRVEDTPVEEAIAKLTPFISHENEWWVRSQAPQLLSSPEALVAAGILSSESAPVRLTLEYSSGRTAILSMDAALAGLFSLPHKARPNPPLYRKYPDRFYWFEYLESSRTLYVKYNSCQNSPALSMTAFANEINAFVAANSIERVVLDVRNNGGGDSNIIRPLTAELVLATSGGATRGDKLFVITGRDTFSSGLFAVVDFKRLGATLVGEPPGNSPSHFGNVISFVLPNSRFVVTCSTRRFDLPDFQGKVLLPDVSAELSSEDFFNERDPALAAILK